MPQRARSFPTVVVTLALCWACGGRASDGDRTIALDDGPPSPDDVAAPVEELPSSVEVLELRLGGQMDDALSGSVSCNPQSGTQARARPEIYSVRFKVNFERREMFYGRCEVEADSVRSSTTHVPVVDADLARIGDAYRALRVIEAGQCTSDAELLTLNLTPERGTLLLYGDEHSDCPAPASQRDGFVSGLDDLYSVLASLAPL